MTLASLLVGDKLPSVGEHHPEDAGVKPAELHRSVKEEHKEVLRVVCCRKHSKNNWLPGTPDDDSHLGGGAALVPNDEDAEMATIVWGLEVLHTVISWLKLVLQCLLYLKILA